MKFAFDLIQNPLIDSDNRNKVVGTLPSGAPVSVERRLDGWQVNLKITVADMVWHDCKVLPEEIIQVNNLRMNAETHFHHYRSVMFQAAEVLNADHEAA
jgi:hypothetical protein